MKKTFLLLTTLLALLCCCGGGDDPEPTPTPIETVTAPVVTSTIPVNNTTGIATGTVNVTITYDQEINVSSDASLQPTVTGGTLSGPVSASGKNLTFSVNCPDYETKVTITIPKGLIGTSGVLAEAYGLSFTTEKNAEKPSGNISSTPLTTNPAAMRLYDYLYHQYGQKTLSSVMADVNWNNKLADNVYAFTKKYPAAVCYDFIHICVPSGNGWINYSDITPVKEWSDAGGIVQLMWHLNVPLSETTIPGTDGSGVTCKPGETTFKASNALVSGTWENKWFYEQMDKVISVILKLKDAGIAATWRPFHEAAGNATAKQQADWTKSWFWWGYDGPETFKQLWHAMFDYFKQKGADNLIWVWTTQNYNGNSQQYYQDTDWYPGDQYVDVVARDIYPSSGQSAEAIVSGNVQEFNEIQAAYPSKMVALGECGNNSGVNYPDISKVWNAGAHWSFFMVWYGSNMTDAAWWRDAMQSANVITRELLPTLK